MDPSRGQKKWAATSRASRKELDSICRLPNFVAWDSSCGFDIALLDMRGAMVVVIVGLSVGYLKKGI
jgi:hypothetical protein